MSTENVHRSKLGHRARLGLGAAATAAVLATAGSVYVLRAESSPTQAPHTAPAAAPVQALPIHTNSYADAVARVVPSVVTIHAELRAEPANLPFGDDMFRQFFGDRLPRGSMGPSSPRQEGLGSGVVVRDGYILTNHHVVDGAVHLTVELADQRRLEATVVGTDPATDLAVLRVSGTGLPTLPLSDSDRVRVGDVVLAVGNPLGLGQTVTMGIVSAKGRTTDLGEGGYQDFIQTDAPINRGNSGGALVTTAGELIGINSQIVSPSGGNIGIGFAIPARMASHVMDEIIAQGKVRRARLGVTVQPVTADIAAALGLSEPKGALVNQVQPGSAAAKAGVRQGDVILAFEGEPVRDGNSLRNQVASNTPGTKAHVTVVRGGREQELQVALDEVPVAEPVSVAGDAEGEPTSLGIAVEPLTASLAGELEVPQGTSGLVVRRVDPDGFGARQGLQPGDVITTVNQQSVRTAGELRGALAKSAGQPALLLVVRHDTSFFVAVPRRMS